MKHIPTSLCAAAAAASATISVGACAKNDKADAAETRQVHASTPAQSAQDQRTARSNAAADVLGAVAAARSAIAQQDKAGAANHVNAALNALVRTGNMPLVPIYTELSQQSVIGPIAAAKKDDASSASSSKPVAVTAVTSGYSRVLLDTSVARRELNAARSALTGGDLKTADAKLKSLEQSVVVEASAARMPLVRARENLWLAQTAANRNDWREVKAELNAASSGLAGFSRAAPPAEIADVQLLQQQISQYADRVQSKHDNALGQINKWWVQVANLTDQPA